METIGNDTLAKRAGVRIDTLRYYERSGLHAPKARPATGYRRYGKVEVARLRFVRAMDCPILKALGGGDSHE